MIKFINVFIRLINFIEDVINQFKFMIPTKKILYDIVGILLAKLYNC